MNKKIPFKPLLKPPTADDWVTGNASNRETTPAVTRPAVPPQKMKRFTIDVPPALHMRTKIYCARRGLKMADVLRELLEREFPE